MRCAVSAKRDSGGGHRAHFIPGHQSVDHRRTGRPGCLERSNDGPVVHACRVVLERLDCALDNRANLIGCGLEHVPKAWRKNGHVCGDAVLVVPAALPGGMKLMAQVLLPECPVGADHVDRKKHDGRKPVPPQGGPCLFERVPPAVVERYEAAGPLERRAFLEVVNKLPGSEHPEDCVSQRRCDSKVSVRTTMPECDHVSANAWLDSTR